ncbi:MAG: membrane protein insertase YidC [Candidatus Hydrogenedentes bacterium]|nr:membrane protein insertase YidC [Candidatus Hydrogenedentota bacterium]
MLLNDNRNRDLQRNQLIALVIFTALFFGYLQMFPPAPPQPAPQPGVTGAAPLDAPPTPQAAPIPAAIAAELPPLPADPGAAETAVLEDSHLRLEFTSLGARLKSATVILNDAGDDRVELVPKPVEGETPDRAIYPLGLRFSDAYLGYELDHRLWTPLPQDNPKALSFALEVPGTVRIVKSFALTEHAYVLDMKVAYTNLSSEPQLLGLDTREPAYSVYWGPDVTSEDENNQMIHQQILWRHENVNEHITTASLEPPAEGVTYSHLNRNPEFMAIRSAYFLVALKPGFEGGMGWAEGTASKNRFWMGLGAPRMEVPAGESFTHDFQLYVGSTHLDTLKAAWPGLEESIQFFTMFNWMDLFAKLLLTLLNWFHDSVYANYGVAIILLTILVRTVMFPLTLKSMKNMKRMQKLGPEMEKIRAEFGDDQQEMNKRLMELYSEHGANPLKGCFPMLLQIPVFIALYRMLASAVELRKAPFVGWMSDLSVPDRLYPLPFEIPMPLSSHPIDAINVLPFLMAGAMVLSFKLTPQAGPIQNPQQKMMMTIMPVFFSFICYSMASGLNLYILTSTLLGIVQNKFVHVSDNEMKAKPKTQQKTAQRPKHFYDAAQAKKKELARDARRDKKQKPRKDDTKAKGMGK